MEDFSLLTTVKVTQGITDTTKSAFGVLDQVSGNFQDAFDAAKGKGVTKDQPVAAKSEPEGKIPAKAAAETTAPVKPESTATKTDTAQPEQPTVTSNAEALVTQEPVAATDKATEAPKEERSAPQTQSDAPKAAAGPQEEMAGPVASTSQATVASSKVTPPDAPKVDVAVTTTPTASTEQVTEPQQQTVVAKTAEPAKKDSANKQEITPDATIQVALAQATPIPVAAPTVENKDIIPNKEEASLTSTSVEKPTVSLAQTQPTKGKEKSVTETPTTISQPALTQEIASTEPQGLHDLSADTQKAGSHDLSQDATSSQDQGTPSASPIILSTDQTKAMQSLENIASKTNVQAPKLEILSPAILAGARSKGIESVQQLENLRASAPQAPVVVSGDAQQVQGSKSVQATKETAPTRYTDKFDTIKSKVLDQVRFKLKASGDTRNGDVQINLRPKYLGDITVHLQTIDNVTKAQFIVENQTVKELIQRSSSELHKQLTDSGMNIESVEVTIADNSSFADGQGKNAFHSMEEQQSAREWLSSMVASARNGQQEEESVVTNSVSGSESESGLNIVA